MTCSTCGRENQAHLTFCQECGQRLGPRIAPPTPPIGIGGPDPYGPPPGMQGRHATALGMPHQAAASARAFADPTPFAPPVATAERHCKICDTVNGPNLRYCTSCGSTLDPAPGMVAPEPVAPAPSPGAFVQPQAPIVPTASVSVAAAADA